MEFQSFSHARHAAHFDGDLVDPQRRANAATWFETGSADYWLHARMYEAVGHFRSDAGASWLTVGDGRFGLDAIRIREKGFDRVTPTDISEALLRKSKEEGRIAGYSVQNAEALTFKDDEFDYSFCKESYHHFPRPQLALYEMLRVTRKAIVLVEPQDVTSIRGELRERIGTMAGIQDRSPAASYEESGNFCFMLSRRETEKVAIGLNLPMMASKGLSSHYVPGCEFARADWTNRVYRSIRMKCAMQDVGARIGLRGHPIIMMVVFKQEPETAVMLAFRENGWRIARLPRNPHVK